MSRFKVFELSYPPIVLNKLGDLELIDLVCSGDENAYREFVVRFLPDLKEECLKKCKSRKIDLHIGEQIAHQTFERVQKYKSFKRENVNQEDPRKSILVWLYRIASNLFYDFHKGQNGSNSEHENYFDNFKFSISKERASELLSKKETAIKIFSKLTKKEQEVILTDIEYKRLHKYLPEKVNEKLAIKLGVKKATIRKIRERAIKKIEMTLKEIDG